MTIFIDSFEAKTQLASLLDRITKGEEVVITQHGKPVARLVGAKADDRARIDETVDRLKRLRKTTTLDGLSWKDLRDAGRR